MATILFSWELGGGLGHLVQMAPLAIGLAKAGHHVFASLRDLSSAQSVFPSEFVRLLPAPFKQKTASPGYKPPVTYAHLLHNIGFGNEPELHAYLAAWAQIYEFVRPDLIVFDHSPTALLAARALPRVKRMVIGSGFCVPPDEYPLRNLHPWIKAPADALLADEQRLLHRVNSVLHARKMTPLERLGQLYSQVDETLLLTFPELDHFPRPKGTRYWGAVTRAAGKSPHWPEGEGKRIYAYLKPFPALPQLLEFLRERRLPTVVYVDGIDRGMQQRFTAPTLRFENQRLDLSAAAAQCDLAIINANHGTTATMLMAGKPMLQIPIVLEQGIMARRIRALGVGLDASLKRPDMIMERLDRLLTDGKYSANARQTAERFKHFSAPAQAEGLCRRAAQLLPASSPFR